MNFSMGVSLCCLMIREYEISTSENLLKLISFVT